MARLAPMIAAFALACASCAPLPEPVPIEAACSATDGDTIRSGDERVRLLGIDAPELAGHCRQGRVCVEGDGPGSRAALAPLLTGNLTIQRFGQDRYGRTLAIVRADDVNLSCRQIASGMAVYVRRWDSRGAVRRDCPDLAG